MSVKEPLLIGSVCSKIDKYDKPRAFLDTIGKNSRRTRSNYGAALVHLEGFLYNRYDGKHNVDSIIDLISYINIYLPILIIISIWELQAL